MCILRNVFMDLSACSGINLYIADPAVCHPCCTCFIMGTALEKTSLSNKICEFIQTSIYHERDELTSYVCLLICMPCAYNNGVHHLTTSHGL